MNWKLFLHGLAAAGVGGAATGAAQASQNGATLKATGLTAAAGGIVSVLAYFLQSPLFKGAQPPVAPPKA